jgi:hypothetical protein
VSQFSAVCSAVAPRAIAPAGVGAAGAATAAAGAAAAARAADAVSKAWLVGALAARTDAFTRSLALVFGSMGDAAALQTAVAPAV